ncbi:MAG: response regulator [Holophaga sp.]|nr:response regulator [Holophaga sp.]
MSQGLNWVLGESPSAATRMGLEPGLDSAPKSKLTRVLVVDDEPEILALVAECLAGKFQVMTASSGETALEQLFVSDPDILLTDIHLPDIDGIELIRQALLVKPRLRILVMTGFGTPEIQNQALQQGALRFLEKPLDLATLGDHLLDISNRSFGLTGDGIDVIDLTQVMRLCRKNGIVEFVAAGRTGLLVFEDGQVIHASTIETRGEPAYHAMVLWREGQFQTLSIEPIDPERTIHISTEMLLMEGVRILDEREQVERLTTSETELLLPNPTPLAADKADVRNQLQPEVAMAQIKDLLNVFMKEESARAALVVDWDGFVIEGVVKDLSLGIEAIGAVISTSLGSTQVIGRELQVGNINLAMFEFENGTVLVRVLGKNGILAVLVDPTANLGLPRLQIRKLAPQLEAALG